MQIGKRSKHIAKNRRGMLETRFLESSQRLFRSSQKTSRSSQRASPGIARSFKKLQKTIHTHIPAHKNVNMMQDEGRKTRERCSKIKNFTFQAKAWCFANQNRKKHFWKKIRGQGTYGFYHTKCRKRTISWCRKCMFWTAHA